MWPWGQRSGTELAVRYLGAVSFRSVGIAVTGSCMRGLVRIEAVRFLGRAICLLWNGWYNSLAVVTWIHGDRFLFCDFN